MKTRVDKYLGNFLIFLLVIITLDVLWGVFTRYALGSQASWSEELARFLLIWISILGAAYASGQKMHLAINLLEPKLSPINQIRLKKIIALLILFFALTVMVGGGSNLVYLTHILGQQSPALQLPMAVIYIVIPVSGLLIVYYQIYNMSLIGKEPLNLELSTDNDQ